MRLSEQARGLMNTEFGKSKGQKGVQDELESGQSQTGAYFQQTQMVAYDKEQKADVK